MEYLRSRHYDRIAKIGHIHLLDATRDPVSGSYSAPGKTFGVIEHVYFDRLDDRWTGLLSVLAPFSKLPIDKPSPRAPAPKSITATDTFDFS
jgi:hypothetical protein